MDRVIISINDKKRFILKDNDKYRYNDKELDNDLVEEFILKLIKMCRSREKLNNKSNHRIDIYENNKVITLTGIDNQVIKYINNFLN